MGIMLDDGLPTATEGRHRQTPSPKCDDLLTPGKNSRKEEEARWLYLLAKEYDA